MAKRGKQVSITELFSKRQKRIGNEEESMFNSQVSENRFSEDETHIMSNDLDMEQNDACVEDNSEELTNTTDAEVEGEANEEALMALMYCQSSCCTDETKPYQPNDKITATSMAYKGRNFIPRWYTTFPWLSLCTTTKKVFCFYCRIAQQRNTLSFSSKAEPTFTTRGFNNWRKALAKFKNHSASSAHAEAMMRWQLQERVPINAQLNTQIEKMQSVRRKALLKQLQCLRFLLRQGLSLRGHTETEENLYQLLLTMMSIESSEISSWLRERKYISPVIVNEQISLMGLTVARTLLSAMRQSSPPWFGITADEATDVTCREQLNISIRWVSSNYDISEDPIGMYCLPNTRAETIHHVILDILTHCSLPLKMCRGQAYDGAAAMKCV